VRKFHFFFFFLLSLITKVACRCVDFSTPLNSGLERIVAIYDMIYTPFQDIISRADFWVFGANLAIEMASTKALTGDRINLPSSIGGPLLLPFRGGRIDRDNCTGLDGDLVPPIHTGWSQMTALFSGKMAMTTNQIVALMGAHTLGQITRNNSGFQGSWTSFSSSFSNLYYSGLIGSAWSNLNSSSIWTDQVSSTVANVMITPDIEMIYSPSSQCPQFLLGLFESRGCKQNFGPMQVVQEFASNLTSFYANFSESWQLLTEYGNATLSELCAQSSDVNQDGSVDILDLVLVIDFWGACEGNYSADLNCDGAVNSTDIKIALSHYD
jgi:catalase (peroxidase I)